MLAGGSVVVATEGVVVAGGWVVVATEGLVVVVDVSFLSRFPLFLP